MTEYKLPEPDLRRPDGVYWNEKQAREIAKAAYAAGLAARVPEGWKMVPVEPTEAMLIVDIETDSFIGIDDASKLYKAMLAAAPEPT